MSGSLGDLIVSLSADTARWQSDMGKMIRDTEQASMKITKAFEGVGANIQKVGTLVTAIAAGAGFAKLINEAVQWNGEVAKMAKTMGTSTQEASVMAVALSTIGVSNDAAVSAVLKLSKTLVTGTGVFDRFHIAVKDSNGNLLPMAQIIGNVNQKLRETQDGSNKNVMAMALYGKSWSEIQAIVKLTPEVLENARATAERLHLVVGAEGVAQSKAYKQSLRDLELVGKSLSIQLGGPLLKAITDINAAFTPNAAEGAGMFGDILTNSIANISESKMRMQGLFEGMKASFSTGWFTKDGKAEIEAQIKAIDDVTNYSVSKMRERLGLIVRARPEKQEDDKDTVDVSGANLHAAQKAADAKYTEYKKAFYETQAGIVKVANDLEAENNQVAYTWGLTDLDSYLNKKNQLIKASLTAEIDAKKKALDDANAAVTKAERTPMYKKENKVTVRDNEAESANISEAMLKREQATKAYNDAVSKLAVDTLKLNESDREAFYTAARGYKEQQAALMDMQGDYVSAANVRKKLDEEVHTRKQLESQVAGGDIEAEKALTALRLLDIAKVTEAQAQAKAKTLADDIYGPASKKQEAYGGGGFGVQYASYLKDFEKEKAVIQAQYDAKIIMEKEYQQKMNNLKEIFSAQQTNIALSMGSDSLAVMKQAFSDNKAMMLLALAGEKSIAMARILMSTEVAANAAIAAAAMIPVGGLAIGQANAAAIRSLGYVSIGIVAASGLVEGMQIAGQRASGGPVASGSSYLVGERGPEIFTPGANGQITNNDNLRRLGSGGDVTIHNSYDFRGADAGTEVRLMQAIRSSSEKTKRDILNSMNRGGEFALASGRVR